MRPRPDDAFLALVAETNDLRRVAGQAVWHLRTLLLLARDRPDRFAGAVHLWSKAAATAFDRMEARLRRAGPDGRDPALRAWFARVVADLARDLPEGDRLLVPFARSLDTRLGEIGRLLRAGGAAPRAFDATLAHDIAWTLGGVARSPRSEAALRIAQAAERLAPRG